jgi:hypothetical protein
VEVARAAAPVTINQHTPIIDGHRAPSARDHPCAHHSRAARLLWTRTQGPARLRRDSEAALDYLSGQVGGVELRELLAHAESMETDQPELDSGT